MYLINGKSFPCCTSVTMGIIGGKWKSVILYYLIEGSMRYNELQKRMNTVTERTLSLQLKKLEEDGVIMKRIFNEKPPLRVEYSLTEFGETLIPLLKSISDWGGYVVAHYEENF
jgi:DNA-binding HxlR family transcriptional regulator